jgi:peroxiredoxin
MRFFIASTILILILAAIWFCTPPAPNGNASRSPSPIQSELREVVQSVEAKIKAGKRTDADLTDDLVRLDALLVQEKGARTDDAAQIIYVKAMLNLEVLNHPRRGKELIRLLQQDYPDTKVGKQAERILQSLEQQQTAKEIQATLVPGSSLPDFTETDLHGKPLSLSQYRGKVVLLHFWASWCAPCLMELPPIVAAYEKYHAQGFEIIGVSLDSDRKKLTACLARQSGMRWPEYFDGTGWENKLAAKYGVEAIPFIVLIGPDGKIISKSQHGEDLDKAVAAALKGK